MQRFDLNQIAPSPWKNGGGSTREIACWPQGAGMESFGWRMSVATIAQAGPFSAFPGIDRQIMLLDGDGVHLHSADGQIDHGMDQRWLPFSFSGDVALDCRLLGGTSTDFNVMTRRGQWSAELQIHAQAVVPGRSAAGLCLVLQGRFAQVQEWLQAGQGLWWESAQDAAVLQPEDESCRLLWVGLQRQV